MMVKAIIVRVVWRIIVIVVCVFVGLILIVVIFQSRFIYYPTRQIVDTPRDILLDYEDVAFTASDGVKLHGWFVPATDQRGVVLFCHGNAGNISHRLQSIQLFGELGMGTFIFDYRGYGRSAGKVSETGTYLDAAAAWAYLTDRRGILPERIVIFGRSVGGAVAVHLAVQTEPAALIAESTFTSMGDLAADLYPYLPIRPLIRTKYNSIGKIGSAGCPVMVIHSRDDEMIGFEHSQRLFEAAPEPKQFLELTGGHNEAIADDSQTYQAAVDAFLSKVLGPARGSTANHSR